MKLGKSGKIAGVIILLLIGVGLGLMIDDIPFLSFETKIDASAILAILSLIATVFLMPFIIEAKRNNLGNIKSMACVDLDTTCNYIDELRRIYKNLLSSNSTIKESEYAIILSTFKQLSSLLTTLSNEFKRRKILPDFAEEVKGDLYQKAYEKCTENLQIGKRVDNKDVQEGLIELNRLFNKIKEYRYRLYE